MRTITLQEADVHAQVGPTLTSEVQLEGCPEKVLLNTGSPSTIVFLLEALARQKKKGNSAGIASKSGAEVGTTNPTIVQLRWAKAKHPVPDSCGYNSW